jgi:hypothetical protein
LTGTVVDASLTEEVDVKIERGARIAQDVNVNSATFDRVCLSVRPTLIADQRSNAAITLLQGRASARSSAHASSPKAT